MVIDRWWPRCSTTLVEGQHVWIVWCWEISVGRDKKSSFLEHPEHPRSRNWGVILIDCGLYVAGWILNYSLTPQYLLLKLELLHVHGKGPPNNKSVSLTIRFVEDTSRVRWTRTWGALWDAYPKSASRAGTCWWPTTTRLPGSSSMQHPGCHGAGWWDEDPIGSLSPWCPWILQGRLHRHWWPHHSTVRSQRISQKDCYPFDSEKGQASTYSVPDLDDVYGKPQKDAPTYIYIFQWFSYIFSMIRIYIYICIYMMFSIVFNWTSRQLFASFRHLFASKDVGLQRPEP